MDLDSLYNIKENKKDKIVVSLVSESHPIFQAHFPQNHILPGFCHIEILTRVLGDNINKINFMKLQQKILPKDIVTYEIETKNNKRKIKILNKNNIVGKIQYEF